MSESIKRIEWLDLAKGIGVILVIMGHMPSVVPNSVRMWIFSFHMPLFFIIAGYFAIVPNDTHELVRALKKKTVKLLVEGYLAFALCFLIMDIAILGLDRDTILKNFYGIFTGTIDRIYWFFLSLYEISILFLFISRVVKKYNALILLSVLLAFIAIFFRKYGINYFRIGSSLYAFGFYCLGYIVKEKRLLDYLYARKYSFIISAVVSCSGSALVLRISPSILDINCNFSIDIALNYLLAICGSWALIFICRYLCEKAGNMYTTRALTFMGMNSFFFFPITNYVPEAFTTAVNNNSTVVKLSSYVIGIAFACVVSEMTKFLKGK